MFENYKKPSLTTDMVLFRISSSDTENTRRNSKESLQVLLIKRDIEPEVGHWSLPGGFVNIDEGIFENVRRKLEFKTGITGKFYVEQLYTWGDLNRDSRGRVVSVSYMGLCNSQNYVNVIESENIQWLDVYKVLDGDYGDLAFDHKNIIAYALERLRSKTEWTDIAFNLLPYEFTMGECQAVYEEILNHPINNFRRKVSEYVKETNKMKQIEGKQFRPSKLYVLNKNRKSKY